MRASPVIQALTLLATLMFLSAPGAVAREVDEIVKALDELFRSESSVAEVEMRIVTPNWERTLEMSVWTTGTKKTFVRISSPRKEKGMGTLRVGNEMWNYLPKVNKVIKVPPSMMASSWMGSDLTNDDIVSQISFVDDYDHETATVDAPAEGVTYIKSTPHEGVPVVWGWVVSAVRDSDLIPLWQKYYDERGRLMRTANYLEPRQFGSRTIPAVFEMTPENKSGHKTVMTYKSAEFDINVDEDIFSMRHLRSPK